MEKLSIHVYFAILNYNQVKVIRLVTYMYEFQSILFYKYQSSVFFWFIILEFQLRFHICPTSSLNAKLDVVPENKKIKTFII